MSTARYHFLNFDVNSHGPTQMLATEKETVEVRGTKVPLVGRTQIEDPNGEVPWIMEHPIKTIDFMPKTNLFQVDTGSILVPDYESEADEPINRLEMAHVTYHRLDRAEFILRRPTPINNDKERTLCEVMHCSQLREEKARNVLLAVMPVG